MSAFIFNGEYIAAYEVVITWVFELLFNHEYSFNVNLIPDLLTDENSVIIHPHVVPNLYDFSSVDVLVGAFDHIRKVNGLEPIDFYCMDRNIPQNIFFYVPQKKDCHTGSEWYEGE